MNIIKNFRNCIKL